MAFLGMGGFDDDPNQDIVPEGVHVFEKYLKKDILSNVTSLIVYSCVDLSIMDKKQPPANDQCKAYACELLSLGLIYSEYSYAERAVIESFGAGNTFLSYSRRQAKRIMHVK